MPGAVFCYHSQNCGGYDYSGNDHHALAQDLRTVARHGLPILSLSDVARAINSETYLALPEYFVAFSCDDGTILDWQDYDHPEFGTQRSFANILRDQLATIGNDAGGNLLTAFVIASPDARHAIDQACYGGLPLSDDHWWPDAAREGLVAIENHSWDHLHDAIPPELLPQGTPGNFYSVDDFEKSEFQVRNASVYIDRALQDTAHRCSLFAYPYGHASDYLSQQYLPTFGEQLGMVGAFTTEQKFIDGNSKPYALPRLVCGDAWRTSVEFEQLLESLLKR